MAKTKEEFVLTPAQVSAVTDYDKAAQHGNAKNLWDLCCAVAILAATPGASLVKLSERLQIWRTASKRVCKVSGDTSLVHVDGAPDQCSVCHAKREALRNDKHLKNGQRKHALSLIPACEFGTIEVDALINPSKAYVQAKLEAYQWASGPERAKGGASKGIWPQGLWYGLGAGVNPFAPETKGGCTSVALAADFVSKAHGNEKRDAKTGKREAKAFAERMRLLVRSGVRKYKLDWPTILNECAAAYRSEAPSGLAEIVDQIAAALAAWQASHPVTPSANGKAPALSDAELRAREAMLQQHAEQVLIDGDETDEDEAQYEDIDEDTADDLEAVEELVAA